MPANFSQRLNEPAPIILDGALATELERRGEDLSDPLWSARVLLEAPEKIRAVHLDYFRAGAEVATTASYQATVEGFARRGLDETRALELIRRAVELAAAARSDYLAETGVPARALFVAGSIGPYGAFLADGSEYSGDYGLSEEELMDFHRPRLAALLEAGVDVLACETIPCLIEAQALVRLLAEFPEAQSWISFSARDGQYTNHGEKLADCAAYLDPCKQVASMGVNCTAPRFIPEAIQSLRSGSGKPIIVYPNSGEIYNVSTKTWQGETDSDAYGAQAQAWHDSGASLIGGCCRTTPAHIAEISKRLRR